LLGNIQANMPPGGNESITEGDYLNIVAHMLQVNGVSSVMLSLPPGGILACIFPSNRVGV
jgi:hypothetical protein